MVTAPQGRPIQYLASTQDLLARFNLHPAYDKYVKPYIEPLDPAVTIPQDNNPTTPTTDKGKGKEKEREKEKEKDQDEDDEDGGATKKKKDTYKHLIRGIPGTYPSLCPFPPPPFPLIPFLFATSLFSLSLYPLRQPKLMGFADICLADVTIFTPFFLMYDGT